jgi:PPP family 3-phenylpropionic acid transporter
VLLRLYYFVFFSALGAFNPYFPSWLRARGIEGLAMSTITVLNPLLGIVSPVVFGVLADSFGLRGSLLRIANVGALLPFVVIALVTGTGHDLGYWTLFGLIAFYAFFRSPMVTIADVTALEEPGSYGRSRLFGSAGFTVMVVLAGTWMKPTSRAALPIVVATMLALTLGVTVRLPTKAVHPAKPAMGNAARLLRSPDFLLFLLGSFLWYAAHVAYDLCFSMHLADVGASPPYVGWCWAIGVAAEMGLMGVAHHLVPRFPAMRLFAFGLAVTAVRFFVVAHVRSLGVLLLLQPLHAVTFALVWVTALEFVRQRAPANLLATAQSLFSVATSMGSAAGMLTWGPLYAKSGGSAVFASAAAVAVAGAATAIAQSVLGARAEARSEASP